MASDKQLKAHYKKVFNSEPEKFYPVNVLRQLGYSRNRCIKCGKYFWSTNKQQNICGDAACIGKYDFLFRRIPKFELTYHEVWHRFARLFSSLGYKPIKRYPVVARWRDDTLYVKASIYDFQPHVTSGLSPPTAKKLVVPQPCLRFNDIDNVGVTMSHMTCFVMIGQHAFLTKDEWSQPELFSDICRWLFEELGIPKQEVVFHEDAWAGGGNLGPCIEYFSGGVELGNQVYMLYQISKGKPKELKLKVLDMGMGMERVAWFTKAKSTIYDATFPDTLKKLNKYVKLDQRLVEKYAPFGAMLNIDETSDISGKLKQIAKALGISKEALKRFLDKTSALYSIVEHSRALLFALNDGSLPSNVGDAYNLRMLFRRSQGFIEKLGLRVQPGDICQWHADELKNLFPELSENLSDIKKILEVEQKKYEQSKSQSKIIIDKVLNSPKELTTDKLIELYESHGVNPFELKELAQKRGVKISIPDNFYALVSSKHKTVKKAEKQEHISLPQGLKRTDKLYYKEDPHEFTAKVELVVNKKGDQIVVLDRTSFYPEGGGQEHDTGTINGFEVFRVTKQQEYVLHYVKNSKLKVGELVKCRIDSERRLQLAQHHTATHIINGVARLVLGPHVYQAGASKSINKARLDITHYEALSAEEINRIEKLANEFVKKKLPIKKSFMNRSKAEQKYSIRIYQGGYIPGKFVRIVEIPGLDTEACGGTHLDNTGQVGRIKITKSSKLQDGVVRIEFVAGRAAEIYLEKQKELTKGFKSLEEAKKSAEFFRVPIEKVNRTLEKFTGEILSSLKQLNSIEKALGKPLTKVKIPKVNSLKRAKELFGLWKHLQKKLEKLQQQYAEALRRKLKEKSINRIKLPVKLLVKVAEGFNCILLVNHENRFVFRGSEQDFKKLISLGAKGGGNKIKQGVLSVSFEEIKKLFRYKS